MNTDNSQYTGSVRWMLSLFERILGICETFSSGRWWLWKVTLLAVFVSLFLAFPSYDAVQPNQGRLALVAKQIEDITGFWREYPTDNLNLAFRLTVPLTARLLNLNVIGVLVIQFLAGILLLYLMARLADRISKDRVVSVLFVLTVASIFAGNTAFVELRGPFDGVALCLLAAAMWFHFPLAITISVFLAAFTDERALLASGFVFLWWALKTSDIERLHLSSLVNSRSLAVGAGCIAYLLLRLYLANRYGVATEPETGIFYGGFRLINNMPMGIWTALEGGWLLVVLAFVALYHRKKWILAVYAPMILSLIVVAMSVIDITRSMAYLLPSLPIALSVLASDTPKNLRYVVLTSAIISLLWPTYYAGGKSSIWWQYPLPMQLVRWLFLTGWD